MKAFNIVMKVVAALAAVAGAVYVIATYGDQIVAWAKKFLNSLPCNQEACPVSEEDFADNEEAPAEETPAEQSAEEAAEEPAEEAPAADDGAPVAEDSDFEG